MIVWEIESQDLGFLVIAMRRSDGSRCVQNTANHVVLSMGNCKPKTAIGRRQRNKEIKHMFFCKQPICVKLLAKHAQTGAI